MSSATKKILLFFCIFTIFVLIRYFGFLKPFDTFFSFIFKPIGKFAVQQGLFVNTYLAGISHSKYDLLKKNAKLESEKQDLISQIVKLQQIKKENDELRSLINFERDTNYTLIVSDILYKNTLESEKTIVLNRGSKNGVKKGDPVIVGNGVLIGKVIRVTPETALVRLTLDQESIVIATIDNAPHTISGVVKGMQGTSLALHLIPKNIVILPGQRAITNGLEEHIPSALYLGEIEKLIDSEHEIFNSALITPPYIIEDLETAAVIISR